MNNLKSSRLVAPNRRCVSYIARLTLSRGILEHHVGSLENFDRKRMRAIFADCLQKPRDERCANHLKFECLGIGYFDCSVTIIFVVQPFEVLFV